MEQLFADVWKLISSLLVAAIGWQFKVSHATNNRLAVLETTVKDLQESVKKDKEDVEKAVKHLQENVAKDIDNIKRDIENIQKRMDSHSKKQDEIVTLIQDFKLAVVKQIGDVSSELKVLTSSMEVFDDGVKFKKKGKKG